MDKIRAEVEEMKIEGFTLTYMCAALGMNRSAVWLACERMIKNGELVVKREATVGRYGIERIYALNKTKPRVTELNNSVQSTAVSRSRDKAKHAGSI